VRNGFVSAGAAEREYGVVVDPAMFAVDEAATARLRGAAA
jgi:N-methylhydantoinase B